MGMVHHELSTNYFYTLTARKPTTISNWIVHDVQCHSWYHIICVARCSCFNRTNRIEKQLFLFDSLDLNTDIVRHMKSKMRSRIDLFRTRPSIATKTTARRISQSNASRTVSVQHIAMQTSRRGIPVGKRRGYNIIMVTRVIVVMNFRL